MELTSLSGGRMEGACRLFWTVGDDGKARGKVVILVEFIFGAKKLCSLKQ